MPNFLLKRGKKEKLIVEVSATGMRAVQMIRDENVPKVVNAFCQSWPHRLILSEDEFAGRLEKVVQELSLVFPPKQHSVVFCCTDATNMERIVQGPVIEDEEELEEWLLQKKVMPSQDDYISDFSVMGDSLSEFKKSQDILVRSVSKKVAQVAMDALEEGGYELEALEYPSNVLNSLHGLWFPDSGQEHEIMFHIGPEISVMAFYLNGVPRFSHVLNFSLMSYLDHLIEKAGMEPEMARKFILEGILPVLYDGAPNPIDEESIQPIRNDFQWLVAEIQRVSSYYYCRVLEWQGIRANRVLCSGLEAYSPGFQQVLRDQLQTSVDAFSLMESVGASEDIAARLGMDQWGSVILWATGLGTRYMDE